MEEHETKKPEPPESGQPEKPESGRSEKPESGRSEKPESGQSGQFAQPESGRPKQPAEPKKKEPSPEELKLWRTLVRVAGIDEERDWFGVIVPAWNVRMVVWLSRKSVPEFVSSKIEMDARFHSHVNTGAEDPRDLIFQRWESS